MIRRIFTVTVVSLFLFTITAAAQTWNCGPANNPSGVTAALSGGTLTISGTGAMMNYTAPGLLPWYDQRNDIINAVIEHGVTSIGDRAFATCANLVSVTIPNSVTTIGMTVFQECRNLASITIPSSVTAIGQNAFMNCSGLTSIISLRPVPPTIGENAFLNVDKTTACLYVPQGSVDNYRSAWGWGASGCVNFVYTVTFNSLGGGNVSSQFFIHEASKAAKPTDPTRSGYVFGGWYRDTAGTQAWDFDTDVVTMDTTLYAKWFWDIGTVPGTVTAFLNDGTLTISGTGAMKNFSDSQNDRAPWHNSRSTIVDLVIGKGVTSIGAWAFFGTALTAVLVPEDVTSIGNMAFRECVNLVSITIGRGVTSIDTEALNRCYIMDSINVAPENLNFSSENGVLFNKNKTTLIRFPEGRQGEYTIPDGVITIGRDAFHNRRGLTSVTIPSSVITIERFAFRDCHALTSATIGSSVTTIEEGAFASCNKLTEIIIPNSVTSIGTNAFEYCTGLTAIISLNTVPPAVGSNAFRNVNTATACLYVPKNSIAAYRAASQWGTFTCINSASAVGYPTVTFDSRSGSAVASQFLVSGDKVEEPAVPTRANYTFGGWHRDTAGTQAWDFDTDVVTVDMTLYAKWIEPISVLTPTRDIPNLTRPEEPIEFSPAAILAGEFTAGPNPVARHFGTVNFFRTGSAIETANLRIFDASGNFIKKISITDTPRTGGTVFIEAQANLPPAVVSAARRPVGSWNLTDAKGRPVSEGTYVVRGTIKTTGGKTERISLIVGVR